MTRYSISQRTVLTVSIPVYRRETVETVRYCAGSLVTGLKPGVNEMGSIAKLNQRYLLIEEETDAANYQSPRKDLLHGQRGGSLVGH